MISTETTSVLVVLDMFFGEIVLLTKLLERDVKDDMKSKLEEPLRDIHCIDSSNSFLPANEPSLVGATQRNC